jgi:hypothetical protein
MKPRVRCAPLILAFALAFGGCGASQPNPPAPGKFARPANVSELIGSKTRAILTGATKVEAFRIRGEGSSDPQRLIVAKVGGYEAVAKSTPSRPVVDRLLAALLNENTYRWGGRTRCIFVPGLGFRFEKGSEAVEILFCFGCKDVNITTTDGEGTREVWERFEPGEAEIDAIGREALGAGG